MSEEKPVKVSMTFTVDVEEIAENLCHEGAIALIKKIDVYQADTDFSLEVIDAILESLIKEFDCSCENTAYAPYEGSVKYLKKVKKKLKDIEL